MQTIGHHTCRDEGGSEFVLQHAPFLAAYDESQGKQPFLGEGYYFWDYNLDLAHHWGRVHCRNKYLILEVDLEFQSGTLLDLVGSRFDMLHLQKIRDELYLRGYIDGDWELSKLISMLKHIGQTPDYQNIFPFQAVRAVDHSIKGAKQIPAKFVSQMENYTLINPRIIICKYEKKDITLERKRIVQKEKQ